MNIVLIKLIKNYFLYPLQFSNICFCNEQNVTVFKYIQAKIHIMQCELLINNIKPSLKSLSQCISKYTPHHADQAIIIIISWKTARYCPTHFQK